MHRISTHDPSWAEKRIHGQCYPASWGLLSRPMRQKLKGGTTELFALSDEELAYFKELGELEPAWYLEGKAINAQDYW